MHVLRTSLTYMYIPVDPPAAIAEAGTLTSYECEAALIADDGSEPQEDDWYEAAWIGGEVALLIGPGSAADFPSGVYFAFARISAGTEKPVLPSGRVRIGLAEGT